MLGDDDMRCDNRDSVHDCGGELGVLSDLFVPLEQLSLLWKDFTWLRNNAKFSSTKRKSYECSQYQVISHYKVLLSSPSSPVGLLPISSSSRFAPLILWTRTETWQEVLEHNDIIVTIDKKFEEALTANREILRSVSLLVFCRPCCQQCCLVATMFCHCHCHGRCLCWLLLSAIIDMNFATDIRRSTPLHQKTFI